MVSLKFALLPEAAAKWHDMLLALAKFHDTVSFEARKDHISISALNSSKSGYASFLLGGQFFESYKFVSDGNTQGARFTCSILNKEALISVFKARMTDTRGRDTAIERCEVNLQDSADQAECRLIITMICAHGVTKTYQLTYESIEVVHALFDRNATLNHWTTRAVFLKEFSEYFGPKAEQLDIYLEDGKVTFLSFTDKIVNSKNEILKHPLKTAVTVNTADFDQFEAQEKLHTIISVKDFKAIVTHAATLNANMTAYYSVPGRPLQFTYTLNGLTAQYTLMTAGDYGATPAPSANTTPAPTRAGSTVPSNTSTTATVQPYSRTDMPPPAKPTLRNAIRKLGKNDRATNAENNQHHHQEDSDSLFVPAEEDDRRWEPTDYDKDEESMGWDASVKNDAGYQPTFRDTQSASRSHSNDGPEYEGLPPTQRISQIQGLW